MSSRYHQRPSLFAHKPLQSYKGAGAALEKLGRLFEAIIFYDYGFELLDNSFYEQYEMMIAYLTCAQTIGQHAYQTGE